MAKVILGVNDLASQRPDLVKDWDFEKNYPLMPSDIAIGSHKEVWWHCSNGQPHSYKMGVQYRTLRKIYGCPYCSSHRLLKGFNDLQTKRPDIAQEWDFERNYPLTPSDVMPSSRGKYWFKCNKYPHSYQSTLYQKTGTNSGCPYCSSEKVLVGFNDLATLRPAILKEWNYAKNTDITPQQVTIGSKHKVWWKCLLCNYSYQAQIVNRTKANPSACPYCSNKKALSGYNDLQTLFPDIAKEWDFERNTKKPSEVYAKSHEYAYWVCQKGHSYRTKIYLKTEKDKMECPICVNKIVEPGINDLATLRPDIAKDWDYEKNGDLTPSMVACGYSSKSIWWKCKQNHSYQKTVASRTSKKAEGCPYCSNTALSVGCNDLVTKYPKIAEEWNYKKNINITPQMVMAGSPKKVWFNCEKGHDYLASIKNRTVNNSGCPYCSGNKVLVGFNDLATTNPYLLKEWDYDRNSDIKPQDLSKGSKKKVWWKCNYGHVWQSDVHSRTSQNVRGCPYCSGSRMERFVYEFLRNLHIPYKREKKFDFSIEVKDYPFDIFVKIGKGLIIEPDGIQHFTDKFEFFERNKSFPKRVKTDNLKNDFCFIHGIPILRIPYVYDVEKDKEKIAQLLKDFISTRKIPQEIIDFYQQFEFSNYAKLAVEWNGQQAKKP